MKDDKRLKRKVRNSYIVSNISIALVLFLLGSVGYLMTAAMQVARTLQESVTVTVELRNGADEKQKESLRKRFEANELVSHVEYSSKDDKLNDTDFRQMFEQEFEAILEENPLLDSFEIDPVSRFGGPGQARNLHRPNCRTRRRGPGFLSGTDRRAAACHDREDPAGAATLRRSPARHLAHPAEQHDPAGDLLETLPDSTR